MKENRTQKIGEGTTIKRSPYRAAKKEYAMSSAYEAYIKRKFPDFGEESSVLYQTSSIAHFEAGWLAAMSSVNSPCKYLTTAKAAKIAGFSASTLLRAIQAGRLRARVTPGGHHRVMLSDVQAAFGEGKS